MSGTTCINVVRGNSLAGPTSNAFLTSESISRYAFSRIRSIENNKYVISLFAINRGTSIERESGERLVREDHDCRPAWLFADYTSSMAGRRIGAA